MNLRSVYAKCYDLLESLGSYQNLQERVIAKLRMIPNLRILDAGCGTGNTIRKLLQLSPQSRSKIIGVDSSTEMCQRAGKKLKDAKNVLLLNGDLNILLEEEETLDRIISVNSLYAVPSPEETAKKWYSMLVNGGIAVVANPFRPKLWPIFLEHFQLSWRKKNWTGFLQFLVFLPGWTCLILLNLYIAHKAKNRVMHFLPPDSLETIFLNAGFKTLDKEIIYGGTVALHSFQKIKATPVRRVQTPEEISQTYGLRYRIYCEEINSLPAVAYPDRFEKDRFDALAIHFLAERDSKIVGCIRLLPDFGEGFLLEEAFLLPKTVAAVRDRTLEISRWIVAPEARSTGLWFSLVETAVEWSKKREFLYWVAVCQKSLWLGLEKRGWGVELFGPYQTYHNTLSAPGIIKPPVFANRI